MRSRVLLTVDALLIIVATWLGAQLYRAWATEAATLEARAPTTLDRRASNPGSPPAPAEPLASPTRSPAADPLTPYDVVAERNLFSPTRTEAAPPEPPKTATAAMAPSASPSLPKPRLYGVVLHASGEARAYLEDPQTRKIYGYRVGDSVAASRVEDVKEDRVVLRRGDEVFEVLLRDPTKPKPPPPPAPVAATPGTPQPAGAQPPEAAPGSEAAPSRPSRERPQAAPPVPRQPRRTVQPGAPGIAPQPTPPTGSVAPTQPERRRASPRRPPVEPPLQPAPR